MAQVFFWAGLRIYIRGKKGHMCHMLVLADMGSPIDKAAFVKGRVLAGHVVCENKNTSGAPTFPNVTKS